MNSTGAAFIIRASVAEVIPIEGDRLRIGRDKAVADLAVEGNDAVSRLHATIVEKDGAYYVVDNGSTNKTYINEAEIAAFEETALASGARLRIADEVFLFYTTNTF